MYNLSYTIMSIDKAEDLVDSDRFYFNFLINQVMMRRNSECLFIIFSNFQKE